MAIINLLPDSKKQQKPSPKEKVKGLPKLPNKLLIIPILIILLLFIAWIALVFQVKAKEKTIASLDKKLLNLKSSYRDIEILNEGKKELSEKLSFYQRTFENNLIWSEKFSSINEVIPDQIWLISVYTETKPNRILVIKGSATSLVESEIIDSISQFAERLKKESSFYKDFSEIKLGPLLSEKKGNLNIMNFSLLCKLK